MRIYRITNVLNEKVYVGQTVRKPKIRWSQHKTISKTSNLPLYNSMRKYGVDKFSFEVIYECKSQGELDVMEEAFIWLYGSNNRELGYNIDNGGCGIGRRSEETKRKISESKKGKPSGRKGLNLSNEHKQNLSISRKGKPSGREGCHLSEETKRKISEAMKNKRKS